MTKSFICTFMLTLTTLTGCSTTTQAPHFNYLFSKGEALRMYITTDTHYLSDTLHDNGTAFQKYEAGGDGKQLGYSSELFDAFIYQTTQHAPDIAIISGDLTNNGEAASHEEIAAKLTQLESTGTHVYVIPGNHDLLNPWARGFADTKQYVTDSITPDAFVDLYGDFGYDEAALRDTDSLSYLATPSEEMWLLLLDTNIYHRNTQQGYPQTNGVLSDTTLEWIEECLLLAKEHHATVLPVMHHSLITHNEAIQTGFTLDNAETLLELFGRYNVPLTLSGHIHIQDISSQTSQDNTIYDIATNALAVYPHQLGILDYEPQAQQFVYHTDPVAVEQWAIATKSTDTHLLNFDAYAETFFGEIAYQMAYEQIMHLPTLTPEEKHTIGETMGTLNKRYFAGTESLNEADILGSVGHRLIDQLQGLFLKDYMDTILVDNDTPDNQLTIPVLNK